MEETSSGKVIYEVEELFRFSTGANIFVVKRKEAYIFPPWKAQLYEDDTPIAEVRIICINITRPRNGFFLPLETRDFIPTLSFEEHKYYLIGDASSAKDKR